MCKTNLFGISEGVYSYNVPYKIKGTPMGIKAQVSGLLALPKELVLNLPHVVMTGRGEIIVENYKNLIEYSDTHIRINTNSGILRVEGERLTLKQITSESIAVNGDIFKLEFLR